MNYFVSANYLFSQSTSEIEVFVYKKYLGQIGFNSECRDIIDKQSETILLLCAGIANGRQRNPLRLL